MVSTSLIKSNKQARVVIVDDSRTMQAILDQILSARLGLDVVGVAGDVESAFELIANTRPDLVTIDLRLPYIDGKVLLERLAQFPWMCKIVVSGHGCDNVQMVSALHQLGAHGCIDKLELSRDPEGFCRKVQKMLARPEEKTRPQPTSPEARPPRGIALGAAKSFPVPADEQARLKMLAMLSLANDDEDAQLTQLTNHLGRTTDFPACLMTFIDREKLWIKAASGFDRGQFKREEAICNYPLSTGETFTVPNATLDARFSGLEAVTKAPHIRAYVGHPIVGRSGVRLGTICLLDTRVRQVPPSVVTNLRSICEIAAGILDARMPELKKCA